MRNGMARAFMAILACAVWPVLPAREPQETRSFEALFSGEAIRGVWKTVHCDLQAGPAGMLRATFWKGYETTGLETVSLPLTDWSAWKSFKFDVTNPYQEPFSVYVRISNDPDHPPALTYTGGTFDGFVIGPGKSTVEISLENMQSAEEEQVDANKIAYLGIFFAPLFLRDGMDLKFSEDKSFDLNNLRLEEAAAQLQKQPYADLLFKETASELIALRQEVEQAIAELRELIEQARTRGIDTAYHEIYPFLVDVAFRQRLLAFWQDRAEKQRETLGFLLRESRRARAELQEVLDGKRKPLVVPAVPPYSELVIRDGYFRLAGEPKLIFGMLYNRKGPLLRWFANSRTDYGTQLVAGGTRHNVERQPIWEAYQRYPETHRVGWERADHIIRDRSSWEVVGPPVNVCLENRRSREAVAKAIEDYLRANPGRGIHLVMNLGYEYFYVCYCDITRHMWEDWLEKKHGHITAANQAWGTRFRDFAEVPMMRIETASSNRALWFDWSSFNLARFLKQIRWTHDQIRRWEPSTPLTVGSPYYAFSPRFWTAIDEEELADSDITGVVLEENYALDTLMPEYLHALANGKPVADFEYHGMVHQILPSFLHGDAAISMWWWNDNKRWTPHEPINEWASSFPQSYTVPLSDVAKAMRDALDIRRLSREIAALGSGPRPIVLLYSKTSMLQHLPGESEETGTIPYLTCLRQTYNASQSAGVYVGLTTEKKILASDLNNRKVLVLPGAEFVPRPVVHRVLEWVRQGGTLVVVPDSLLADEYARPTATLQSLGLRLLRRQPPKLKRGETQVTEYNLGDLPRLPLLPERRDVFSDELPELLAVGGQQILECDPRLVLAKFPDGSPAIVLIPHGEGNVYWLAMPLEPARWGRFLSRIAARAGVSARLRVWKGQSPFVPELEYRVTEFSAGRLAYLYNNSERPLRIRLEPQFPFSKIRDRRTETSPGGMELELPGHETAILEFR